MPSIESLINQSIAEYKEGLLIIDENLNCTQLTPAKPWLALTNRLDQYEHLLKQGWPCQFNDFIWPTSNTFTTLIFRIAKEKAINHHLLNLAADNLPQNARVILFGEKSEGIKSLSKHAQKRLGGERLEEKIQGDLWRVTLTINEPIGSPLNDLNYQEVREVAALSHNKLYSKPGVYGWQKIDKGSQLLLARLPEMLGSPLPLGAIDLLDLGCGSGYLALGSSSNETRIIATDNNAAALIATHTTLEKAGLNATTVASNAGEGLAFNFDLILCNPPFHSGFGVDYTLTERFINQSAKQLKPNGKACFVVNQHVPLKRIAANYFASVTLDTDNGSFCTYQLSQPKRSVS